MVLNISRNQSAEGSGAGGHPSTTQSFPQMRPPNRTNDVSHGPPKSKPRLKSICMIYLVTNMVD